MPNQVTIQGLDELLRKLSNIESLVEQKKIVARSVRAGAEIVQAAAKAAAPRGKTGNLAESISISVTEQTASHAFGLIGPSRRGFYGLFLELGTAHIVARPFLQPAFDSVADEAYQAIADVLRDEIEAEAT